VAPTTCPLSCTRGRGQGEGAIRISFRLAIAVDTSLSALFRNRRRRGSPAGNLDPVQFRISGFEFRISLSAALTTSPLPCSPEAALTPSPAPCSRAALTTFPLPCTRGRAQGEGVNSDRLRPPNLKERPKAAPARAALYFHKPGISRVSPETRPGPEAACRKSRRCRLTFFFQAEGNPGLGPRPKLDQGRSLHRAGSPIIHPADANREQTYT
jgi:hypothetical protein